jgi:hypothetical protein
MPFVEMVGRYGEALGQAWPVLLAGALLAGLVQVPRCQARLRELPRRWRRALLGVALGLGASWAAALAWVCDDAFISFRYAANLLDGHGLVWNPGERVEGYTNFLWTLLLAGPMALGIHPAQAAVVLGLAALAATLLVVARLIERVRPDAPWTLPVAVLALALNHCFASFGTSGLETMAATLGVTLAIERALAGAPLASGLCGVLAAMAHPDHGLFYAALGLALALDPARRRELLRYALPFLLLYLPYFAWRWTYYGAFFPNTYYAKSGGEAYFAQGLTYLGVSFIGGGLWAVTPLAALGLWHWRASLLGRFSAIVLPLYLGYVAKIGGDYMVGRLVVATLPLLFVLAELGAARLIAARPYLALAALLAFVVAAAPTPLHRPREARWQTADERTHTPLVSFSPPVIDSPMFARAQLFRRMFVERGERPRIADIEIGMMGFYTGLEVIDCHGLTDAHVAREPIERRGRPGHEKLASVDYLHARRVDLSRLPLFAQRYWNSTRIDMPDRVPYFFARWRPPLAAALAAQPGISFPDATLVLRDYVGKIGSLPAAVVAADLRDFFEPYYFTTVADPVQRAAFDQRLAASR